MSEIAGGSYNDWEPIPPQSSSLSSSGREWQMVETATTASPPPPPSSEALPPPYDDFSNIFPPSSHEGLHVQPESESRLTQSTPASVDVESHPSSHSHVQVGRSPARMVRLAFEVLYSKLPLLRRLAYCGRFSRRQAWSYSAGVVVGIIGFFLYLRRRRRAGGSDSLLLLVREKDEVRIYGKQKIIDKISQLLRQIAQMNEKISRLLHQTAQLNDALSVKHRIPVIRSC